MAKVIPHYAEYDKKCLLFRGFFQQRVPEPSTEGIRTRIVNIIYYLEDDTLTVVEPPVHNSGLTQGKLVRRDRVPNESTGHPWHWKDFNVDIDVRFYGISYRICNCDAFTREFLLSQGIEMNEERELPVDPTPQEKHEPLKSARKQTLADEKFRQYLQFDGKVLRFYAVWLNSDGESNEKRPCTIYYYLSDDRMEILEAREINSGRDPFPRVLNRMRVPKNWEILPASNASSPDAADMENVEYFGPRDLLVGETLYILRKQFFLYDCDLFTRRFYKNCLNIEQGPAIDVKEPKERFKITPMIPPHIGIGQPEDTIQSCLTLKPVPLKKNMIQYVTNAGKVLRYKARLDWIHPEDKDREFVIHYSLADGLLSISEKRVKNSGFEGGRFLKPMLLMKPDSDTNYPQYYNPTDFRLGSIVHVYGQRFIITGAALSVLRYMEENPEKFRPEHLDEFRNYFSQLGVTTHNETRLESDQTLVH
ncbi:EF-hand domain-containing protein 1-like [Bemisia tabaci]